MKKKRDRKVKRKCKSLDVTETRKKGINDKRIQTERYEMTDAIKIKFREISSKGKI